MKKQELLKSSKKNLPCVTLIGMPGAGKTTVGMELARALDWAFMDTDKLLEALYSRRLQDITDYFGKDEFLKVESGIIQGLDVSECVIATGGSVIYSDAAVARLLELGPLVYLEMPFSEMERRIAENPERGIAIAPGQTLAELYEERVGLYNKSASFKVDNSAHTVDETVALIRDFLTAR